MSPCSAGRRLVGAIASVIAVISFTGPLRAQDLYAGKPPGGIDRKTAAAEASRLNRIIRCHQGEITSISRWGNRVQTLHTLGLEEGLPEHPMPRTGFETKFYNRIKESLRLNPGEKLDKEKMLRIGLEVCSDPKGAVNLPDVYLTVHNVVRLLARPDMLVDPKARAFVEKDPAVGPIVKDMFSGRKEDSSDGHDTLATVFKVRLADRDGKSLRQGDVVDKKWTLSTLFAMPEPDGSGGLFQPVQGVRDSTGNGGAYYYFWLGTFAGCTGDVLGVGEAGLGGMWLESDAKKDRNFWEFWNQKPKNPDEYLRGVMQLTHFGAGNILGDRSKWSVAKRNLKGGFVAIQQKQKSRYCTNNPNIDVPMPIPPEVKRNDLAKASTADQGDLVAKLLASWRARGLDVTALDAFRKALLDRQTPPKDRNADMPWLLKTLSLGDPTKIAREIDRWLASPEGKDPRIQDAAKAAIAALGKIAGQGGTSDTGC